MTMRFVILLILAIALVTAPTHAQDAAHPIFYAGVDLSYVNEMEDCGAVYRVDGVQQDPYALFAAAGANLARVRLWHTPTWTGYSTLADATRSLRRAVDAGMVTLLDFHYSDTWADPGKQTIPAAWADLIDDIDALGDAVYQYTYDTLMQLHTQGLMPQLVQVGNEINSEILRAADASGYPINWARNAALLNRGIEAVRAAGRDSGTSPRVMLHIAKPEEAEGWLMAAERAGVTDFDIIGISYYAGWSRNSIRTTGAVINQLRYRFNKDVMIAETAYPWTLASAPESASNMLGLDFLIDGYPATPDGQRRFMTDLTQTVISSGGLGVIYWEPAWVSTPCSTLWGQGSHWENATFFDFQRQNALHEGIDYLNHPYEYPIEVTLSVTLDAPAPEQVYLRADFTGLGRRLLPIPAEANGVYTLRTRLMPGTTIRYQFYRELPASDEVAIITGDCIDPADGLTVWQVPDAAATAPVCTP